jgi:deoxyribodipyrimidine photolyase-related protein
MKPTALIFPHQLFAEHPAFPAAAAAVLVEDPLFFGDHRYPARFHRQKLILHRASMKAYAARLQGQGIAVTYLDYDPERSMEALIAGLKTAHLRVADPVDDVLERRLQRACAALGVELEVLPTPMFLTPLDWANEVLPAKPPYRMASFYTAQRKRLGVLVEDDKPVGGAWSFDVENRKKWPRNRVPPAAPQAPGNAFVEEATAYVARRFPDHPGALTPFTYAVTPEDAAAWLDQFLAERLEAFGTYEDAMGPDLAVLHHSVLTPMLNIGLLTPDQVLQRTLAQAQQRAVPLNDLEGFIRQVIGWREFMMVMYRRIGVGQRTANFWNHQRPMPEAFYTGETGLEPVDVVIRRLLQTGYSHHIERLMIVGNVMLLCGIEPDAVYRWFMELYVDAYDWVMVPNVYGMSQFADGGWLCTKPYISGSNYVKKMSSFKPGPWCAIWDGLFWRFIHTHRAFFTSQPRLSMMARQLDKMDDAKLAGHLSTANRFLDSLK